VTLAVTPDLVERAAADLAAGGWRFTLRQLYYAACAEAEIPPNNAAANGEIGTGALLALVALILVRFTVVFAALLSVAVVLIAFGVVSRTRRRPPTTRVLAISYAAFAADYGDADFPGLIREAVQPVPADADVAVICDTEDTAGAVAANLSLAGLEDVRILSGGAVPQHELPQARIALHDASPRGCALVADLRDDALGAMVVDAGLRPAEVDTPANQVLEGAPARMPRDLSSLLTGEELGWLMSGRRVELATLSPEALMARVRRAVDQVRPAASDARSVE